MSEDPVLARRALAARAARLGQRAGGGCFALAIAVFVAGALTGFPGPIPGVTIALLALGSLLLAPAIVLGYAVRAAEREDREAAERHRRARHDADPPTEDACHEPPC